MYIIPKVWDSVNRTMTVHEDGAPPLVGVEAFQEYASVPQEYERVVLRKVGMDFAGKDVFEGDILGVDGLIAGNVYENPELISPSA
jgi:hypothetical protein